MPNRAAAHEAARPLDQFLRPRKRIGPNRQTSIGADVIKIEPREGEPVRGWPPIKDGTGYFFTYTNVGKRSLVLDLERPPDVETLKNLVGRSDVLIENLKPGALAKRG